jgi:hypothetical protein
MLMRVQSATEGNVLDEKIQRIKVLIEQREKIDTELAELLNVKLKRPRAAKKDETEDMEPGHTDA